MLKDFDLILIFTNFRRCPSYLSVIKCLSINYKIGILKVPIDRPEKTIHTDGLFLRLCEDFGANLIEPGQEATANVVVIPQWPYSEDAVSTIRDTIRASNTNVMMYGLTWAGLHDEFVKIFNIHKIFVIDHNLFWHLLKGRDVSPLLVQEIVEVGMPFEKYPVFAGPLDIDYVIAIPTPFSFPDEREKIIFLENILNLIDEIRAKNPTSIIAMKKHNATEEEYFVSQKSFAITSKIENGLSRCGLGRLTSAIRKMSAMPEKLRINLLYSEVIRKTVSLDKMSIYSNFPLEIFFPCLKEGLIGGLSNTMWYALYFKKKFYNCIPESVIERLDSKLTLKNSLKYFGIPSCNGKLTFDPVVFDKISNGTRESDLIEILKKELIESEVDRR
jgi:hypothetical protein